MKIEPINQPGAMYQGHLKGVGYRQVVEKLGFEPNCEDDTSKVNYSWGFTVDGIKCGIWDYYGSQWSYYGPKEIMIAIFGEEHVG